MIKNSCPSRSSPKDHFPASLKDLQGCQGLNSRGRHRTRWKLNTFFSCKTAPVIVSLKSCPLTRWQYRPPTADLAAQTIIYQVSAQYNPRGTSSTLHQVLWTTQRKQLTAVSNQHQGVSVPPLLFRDTSFMVVSLLVDWFLCNDEYYHHQCLHLRTYELCINISGNKLCDLIEYVAEVEILAPHLSVNFWSGQSIWAWL